MKKTLIIYSSVDGQTKKIATVISDKAKEKGLQVTLVSLTDVGTVSLIDFDNIVLGAAIRYGKHNKKVHQFVKANKFLLESKANAFFSVNVTARKEGKDIPETNTYINKFIQTTAWQPQNLAVFAGRIHYKKYNFFDRNMIKFIMKLTKGPTANDTNIEFTDWNKVSKFCDVIYTM